MRKHYIQPSAELITTSLIIQVCFNSNLNNGPGGGQLTNEGRFETDELQLNNTHNLWEDE